jgi:hypothetical protein
MDLVLFVMLLLRFEMDFFRLRPTSNCADFQSFYRVCVWEELMHAIYFCKGFVCWILGFGDFCFAVHMTSCESCMNLIFSQFWKFVNDNWMMLYTVQVDTVEGKH